MPMLAIYIILWKQIELSSQAQAGIIGTADNHTNISCVARIFSSNFHLWMHHDLSWNEHINYRQSVERPHELR